MTTFSAEHHQIGVDTREWLVSPLVCHSLPLYT